MTPDPREEIARWIGKSGFASTWERCLSEADGLLDDLRASGVVMAGEIDVERLAYDDLPKEFDRYFTALEMERVRAEAHAQGRAEALAAFIGDWVPQHEPYCASQLDDPCICGVGPEYERMLAAIDNLETT